MFKRRDSVADAGPIFNQCVLCSDGRQEKVWRVGGCPSHAKSVRRRDNAASQIGDLRYGYCHGLAKYSRLFTGGLVSSVQPAYILQTSPGLIPSKYETFV